jgi:hypothetical protein
MRAVDRLGDWVDRHVRWLWGALIAVGAAFLWADRLNWL